MGRIIHCIRLPSGLRGRWKIVEQGTSTALSRALSPDRNVDGNHGKTWWQLNGPWNSSEEEIVMVEMHFIQRRLSDQSLSDYSEKRMWGQCTDEIEEYETWFESIIVSPDTFPLGWRWSEMMFVVVSSYVEDVPSDGFSYRSILLFLFFSVCVCVSKLINMREWNFHSDTE